MHVRLSYWAIASVLIAGCGDDSTTTSDGAGSSETGMSTPQTSGEETTSGADGTSSGGGAGTSGSDGGTTTGDTEGEVSGDPTGDGESSSGGSDAMVDATMSGLMINQDCMPIVANDPVGAGFMLELDNVGEVPATVSIVSATFIDDRSSEVGTIGLTPPVIGPIDPGDDTSLFMNKLADSLMPATGCSVVLCNETYTLEVVLDIEGSETTVSDSATVMCVF